LKYRDIFDQDGESDDSQFKNAKRRKDNHLNNDIERELYISQNAPATHSPNSGNGSEVPNHLILIYNRFTLR